MMAVSQLAVGLLMLKVLRPLVEASLVRSQAFRSALI